ncbi:HAD family hydrolase [Candidatus Woesearchaeota archaeon]|nr:HAD family hydrolase [Candidatus Woesearchaeota archaeon]
MNLLFDLDETLYTSAGLRAARQEALYACMAEKLSLPCPACMGLYEKTNRNLKAQGKKSNTIAIALACGLSLQDIFVAFDWVDPGPYITPDITVQKICQVLSTEHNLSIFTNSPAKAARKVLACLGVDHMFKKIFSADTLGYMKPQPEAFLHVVAVLGQECVMIGNSPEKDLLPAKHLGMVTIALHPPGPYPFVDYFIASINELPAVLAELKRKDYLPSRA